MKLAVSAYFVEAADNLVVNVWFQNDNRFVTKDIGPSSVLIFAKQSTEPAYTLEFDRRMGNKDGSFKFCVAHPTIYKGLRAEVRGTYDTPTGSELLAASIDVVLVETEEDIPLRENTATDAPGYREKKIITEQR